MDHVCVNGSFDSSSLHIDGCEQLDGRMQMQDIRKESWMISGNKGVEANSKMKIQLLIQDQHLSQLINRHIFSPIVNKKDDEIDDKNCH